MNSVLKDKLVSILTGIIIVTVVLVISYNTLISSNTDMLSGIFNMTIIGGILIAAFVYIAYHFNIDLLNFFKKGGSIFNFAEGFKESFKEGMGPNHTLNGMIGKHFITQGGCQPPGVPPDPTAVGKYFCKALYGNNSQLISTPVTHRTAKYTEPKIHRTDGCTENGGNINTSDCGGGYKCKIGNWWEKTDGVSNVICSTKPQDVSIHYKSVNNSGIGRADGSDRWKNLISNKSTQYGYCEKNVDSLWGFNNRNVCGQNTYSNIAWEITIRFKEPQGQRKWEVEPGVDFGLGGAAYLDGERKAYTNEDQWGGGQPDKSKVKICHNVKKGNHIIQLYGSENCCDGTSHIRFRRNGGVWKNMTKANLEEVAKEKPQKSVPKIDQSWFNIQPGSTPRSLSKGAMVWTGNTTENYMLQFDLFPRSKTCNEWTNIMHNTMTPSYKNCCSSGDRHPAIWFYANSTRLHIRTGHNSIGNHGWDPTDDLPLNKWTTIKITVNDRYAAIRINLPTKTLYKVIKMDKRKSGNTKMYFSDPWYASANALVRNIKWEPNFKADPDFGQFDYAANDFKQIPNAKDSPKECQDECKKDSECTHFSFVKDWNCWLKKGTPNINTSEESKERSKVYPILSGLKDKKTKWSCIPNISTPVRLDPDTGDVSCLSNNGRDCKWGQCDTELGAFPTGNEPLVCGPHHAVEWGGPGYENPDHWCNKAKSALGWIPNKCTCDNGSAATGLHDCDSTNSKKCIACNPGYHLVGRECKPNTCICSNGTPVSEGDPACTTNNANICSSCNGGYTLKGKACTPNVCTCENGTPVAEGSASCTKSDENVCKSCHKGYHIDGVTCVKDPWTQEKGKECVRKEFVNKDPQQCKLANWSTMKDRCQLNEVGLADAHIIEELKDPPNCNWSSVSSSVKTPDNYTYMFDGCCRGDAATTWVMKGNMTATECARKCDEEDDCNAIEVNGCLTDSENCSGKCYHFKGTKGGNIKFGGCVTTGDQKCYKKIQHYIQDVPPGDTPTDAVPPAHLLPTDPPCPEGCVAPRKSTGNCTSVSKKGANWRECPFTCATPFGEGCNYDQDCTKAKCGAHYCSNVDGTPCPNVKKTLDNAEGILLDKETEEWNGSVAKFTSTSKKDSNKGYNAQGEAVKKQAIQSVSDPLDKIQQIKYAPIPQGYTVVNKNVIQRVLINKTKEWKNISKNENIDFTNMGKDLMLEVSLVRSLTMPQISAHNYKIVGQQLASIVIEKNKGKNIDAATDKLVNIVSNILTNARLSNNVQKASKQFATTTHRTTNMMNANSNALINELSINDNSKLGTKDKYSSTYKPFDSLFTLS